MTGLVVDPLHWVQVSQDPIRWGDRGFCEELSRKGSNEDDLAELTGLFLHDHTAQSGLSVKEAYCLWAQLPPKQHNWNNSLWANGITKMANKLSGLETCPFIGNNILTVDPMCQWGKSRLVRLSWNVSFLHFVKHPILLISVSVVIWRDAHFTWLQRSPC